MLVHLYHIPISTHVFGLTLNFIPALQFKIKKQQPPLPTWPTVNCLHASITGPYLINNTGQEKV